MQIITTGIINIGADFLGALSVNAPRKSSVGVLHPEKFGP